MRIKISVPRFSRREKVFYTILALFVFVASSVFSAALRQNFNSASAAVLQPPEEGTIEAQYTIIYGFTSGGKITTTNNESDKPTLQLSLLDGVSTGTFSFTESWNKELSHRVTIPNGYGYQVVIGDNLPSDIDESIKTQVILYKLHLVDPEPQIRQKVITETFSFNGELLPLFVHIVPTAGYDVSSIYTDHVDKIVVVVMFDTLDQYVFLPMVAK